MELYRSRFRITKDIDDLDVAISDAKMGLDSGTLHWSTEGERDRAKRRLAGILVEKFEITQDVDDLGEGMRMMGDLLDKLLSRSRNRVEPARLDYFSRPWRHAIEEVRSDKQYRRS